MTDMDYRMKCDAETKTLHDQLATVTAERDELAAALKIACDYAREYEDCPFIEGEAALAKLGAGTTAVSESSLSRQSNGSRD